MSARILVVEDDLLNRMFYCEVLAREGFTIDQVGDGAKAMEHARRFGPDLVIMDINLPHVSGISLMEEIRADSSLCAVPILAVTAYVGHDEERRIREAGASAYLSKPVTIGDLLRAIRLLLTESDAARRPS